MSDLIRFGRHVPLPSSVQILHDLLAMERSETASQTNGLQQITPKSEAETAEAPAMRASRRFSRRSQWLTILPATLVLVALLGWLVRVHG